MSGRLLHPDEYELASDDSQETLGLDELDFQPPRASRWLAFIRKLPLLARFLPSPYFGYRSLKTTRATRCSRPIRRLIFHVVVFMSLIILLVILTSIFRPSYTHLPPQYALLRRAALASREPGRANPHDETVFVAASLYDNDGRLTGGQWGRRVLELIDLLGKDNVFLSIYENGNDKGEKALRDLESHVRCNKSLVHEEHVDLKTLPTLIVPGGSKRIKRMDLLAEARNRALKPLDDHADLRFDKLLFLNDVVFDPIDAAQLLFSTNASEQGHSQYRAACSVDFANPFKFYDTFAARDLQGYSMGVPFFPWFSTAGKAESRKDVLAGKDAVRVRSCWGGMVAFDAKYFLAHSGSSPGEQNTSPVRFRSASDMYWEGSECCIIHADIQDAPTDVDAITDTGIYMNPFVRVAYNTRTLSWLWPSRRFEKLYSPIHTIVDHVAGMPRFNPRRTEIPGQLVNQTIWVVNEHARKGGLFEKVTRSADNDGFCARRALSVIKENRKPGEKGWEHLPIPAEL